MIFYVEFFGSPYTHYNDCVGINAIRNANLYNLVKLSFGLISEFFLQIAIKYKGHPQNIISSILNEHLQRIFSMNNILIAKNGSVGSAQMRNRLFEKTENTPDNNRHHPIVSHIIITINPKNTKQHIEPFTITTIFFAKNTYSL